MPLGIPNNCYKAEILIKDATCVPVTIYDSHGWLAPATEPYEIPRVGVDFDWDWDDEWEDEKPSDDEVAMAIYRKANDSERFLDRILELS